MIAVCLGKLRAQQLPRTALRRPRPWLLVMLAGGLSSVALLAQPQHLPRFTTRTDAIQLDVLVTRNDQPVNGLTAADFEVIDDGVPQAVSLISQGELPVDVVLALDVSTSMIGDPLVQLVSASRALVDSLRPDDRLALLTFSHLFDTFVPLTRDRAQVRTVLTRSAASGGTSLNDAAYAALLAAEPGNRTLVMLFTDGHDSTSWLTSRAVADVARRLDAVVYGVTLREPEAPAVPYFVPSREVGFARKVPKDTTRPDAPEPVTDLLPRETGGRLITVDRPDRLQAAFRDILNEFSQRYLLAYEPSSPPKPGWHTLTVTLKSGRRALVRARPGYFAPAR